MIGSPLNVHVSSIEALLQRITEDLATHAEFEGGDVAVVTSGQEIVAQIKKRLATLRTEVEAISLDPDTSETKKTKLATEAVAQAYKDLQFVTQAATTKQAAADAAKQQLLAPPPATTNETTDYLIGAEIRQRLRLMPTAERMTLFAQSMASKAPAIRRAVETDPLGEALIPQDFLTRVVEEHAIGINGKAWQRMKSLQRLGEQLRMVVTALELSLKGYGQTPAFPSKPTSTADLKMQDTQAAPPKSQADAPPPTQPNFQ